MMISVPVSTLFLYYYRGHTCWLGLFAPIAMFRLSHERLVTIGGGNSDLRATSGFSVRSEVQSGDDRYNCFWSWHKYGLFFFVCNIRTFSRLICIYHYFFGLTTKMTQVGISSAAKKCSSFGISVSSRSRISTDWYVAHSSPMDDPASVFVWWNSSLTIKELTNFISIRKLFYLSHNAPYEMIYKIQVEHESADCCFTGSLVQKAHWKFVLCRERLINKPTLFFLKKKKNNKPTLLFGKTLTSLHNWFDFSIRGIEFILQVRSIAV